MDESTIRIITAIIGSVATIIATIVSIFAYKNNSYNKRAVQDLELTYKYFSKENIKKTELEHEFLKDMACSSVSYFKGKKFD
ncbi:hypothetical protein, partial [Rodentibacter sp. Ppn85]|uniref:hypothetical protein n=1 Tax=Rodentibacter sp. Ppn85 TaxID=1908525 RepID=UPI00117A1B04